jgi:hypothetical protein
MVGSKKGKDPELSERAFISASHRDNREMDGRRESAKKADEIHFERTGKHLDINDDAILNKEMYKEVGEEDEEEEVEEEKPTPRKKVTTHHK